MPTPSILPPEGMNAAERKSFSRIVDGLISKGINPAPRAHLIEDFVYSEGSIAQLRTERKRAKGKERLQTIRALNVASAERRRIHDALFAPEKQEASAALSDEFGYRYTEADIAWIQFFSDRDNATTPAQRRAVEAREAVVTKQFGTATIAAIVFNKDSRASRQK